VASGARLLSSGISSSARPDRSPVRSGLRMRRRRPHHIDLTDGILTVVAEGTAGHSAAQISDVHAHQTKRLIFLTLVFAGG
jgi:hypothetical protein